MDYDQLDLDAAYDQNYYEPVGGQTYARLVSNSDAVLARIGAPRRVAYGPSEIEALDYYIRNFVWGGLQQTTAEPYPFGIYGIPDWKTNRESLDPGRNGQRHLWRIYLHGDNVCPRSWLVDARGNLRRERGRL